MTETMSVSDNMSGGLQNCYTDWNWYNPIPLFPAPAYNPPAQVTITYPVYLTDPKLTEEMREQVKEIRRLTDEVRKLRKAMK